MANDEWSETIPDGLTDAETEELQPPPPGTYLRPDQIAEFAERNREKKGKQTLRQRLQQRLQRLSADSVARKVISVGSAVKRVVHLIATAVANGTRPYRPQPKARDWDLPFGPVYGEAGTSTVIVAAPQCMFSGEKIIATDSFNKPGYGTKITVILVGQKLQRPIVSGGTPTAFFGPGVFGNGIKWDTCEPGLCIMLGVSFIESCTFDANVFGKAVL